MQNKPVEAYRNTFANLALPLFAMAEPIPPKVRTKVLACWVWHIAHREQLQVVWGEQSCRLPGMFVQAPLGCAACSIVDAILLKQRSTLAIYAQLFSPDSPSLLLCSPSSSTTWSGACGTAGSWRATSPSTRSAAVFAGAIACCAAPHPFNSVGRLDPWRATSPSTTSALQPFVVSVAAGAVPRQAAGGLFHARTLCLCPQSCSNGLSWYCGHLLQVLEWFRAKGLEAHSLSCSRFNLLPISCQLYCIISFAGAGMVPHQGPGGPLPLLLPIMFKQAEL